MTTCEACGGQWANCIPQAHIESGCRNLGGMLVPSSVSPDEIPDFVDQHARNVAQRHKRETLAEAAERMDGKSHPILRRLP